MILAVAVYVITSWEHEMPGVILFNFLVDFLFEFYEFLLHFVIDMPLVIQKFIWVIFFTLVLVIDALALLADVVDCALDHAVWSYIERELLVALKLCDGSFVEIYTLLHLRCTVLI